MDHCQKCGTCCRKGGPAIHREDKKLLQNGLILLKYLFTIRKDEPVYDNVRRCIISSPSDIIRIKSLESSNVCVFFNLKHNNCTIYDNRPLECRLLKCWATGEIENNYDKGRLLRQELLENAPQIKDIVEYHENRCAYSKIRSLILQSDHGKNTNALANIREILAFDKQFRLLAIEKFICKEEILDFLFGLPLTKTFPRMMRFSGSF